MSPGGRRWLAGGMVTAGAAGVASALLLAPVGSWLPVVIGAAGGGLLLLGGQWARAAPPGASASYRHMVEKARDGIAVIENGRVVFANPSLASLIGRRPEELQQQPFEPLVAESERDAVRERYRRRLAGEPVPDRYETELLHADGRRIPVQVNASLIRDGGSTTHLVVVRDIRAQRAAAAEIRALNTYMDGIIDNADIWMSTLDEEGRVVIWNKAAERISGYRREEVVGRRDVWDWLYPDPAYREWVLARVRELLETACARMALETTIVARDGRRVVLSWNSRQLPGANGRATGALAIGRDVTAERAAAESLRLHASVFETAEPMVIADRAGRLIRVNDAFTRLLGESEASLLGRSLAELGEGDRVWDRLVTEGRWHGELVERHRDGREIPVRVVLSTVRDAEGEITHYIGHWQDISERKAFEARIERQALHDPLTRLANRRLLIMRLEQELARARRTAGHGALLFLDLDHFKQINDSYGHALGDALLTGMAERLQSILRTEDMAARLGGDEFVVLLGPEAGSLEGAGTRARRVGEKLLAELYQPMALGDYELRISGSVGIALYPEERIDAEQLLQRADHAMYRAKAEGRNRLEFFSPALQAESEARRLRYAELRQALDADALQLHYQPLVGASGLPVGAECLVRWPRGEGPPRAAREFMPLANDTGLAAAVDTWVLTRACQTLAELAAAGMLPAGRHLGVNVSLALLALDDFPRRLQRILDDTGASPEGLVIELGESALLRDGGRLATTLRQVREWGVRFAVDDFGTGHSSVLQLRHLPVDWIKVDRTFVGQLPDNDAARSVVNASLGVARSLGLEVVAEGVETQAQFEHLRGEGCALFQGSLFWPPLERDALDRALDGATPAADTVMDDRC
ncbi:sensor domain-containing protein [Spiribacter halobius]|nr:PAS domain S-box protein [Spiribacter halobius]UEX76510.1 PAS domain S-box protein [Spiribacter halobius]